MHTRRSRSVCTIGVPSRIEEVDGEAEHPDVVRPCACQPDLEQHLGHHHHSAVWPIPRAAALRRRRQRRRLIELGPPGDLGHVVRWLLVPVDAHRWLLEPAHAHLGRVPLRRGYPDLGVEVGIVHLHAPAGVVGIEGEVVEFLLFQLPALEACILDGEEDQWRSEADDDDGGDGDHDQGGIDIAMASMSRPLRHLEYIKDHRDACPEMRLLVVVSGLHNPRTKGRS
uniref:Uncharacterized protein n=1 Tax=Setaria italica TaxID=4555 RepID=K3ZJS5_SETIT